MTDGDTALTPPDETLTADPLAALYDHLGRERAQLVALCDALAAEAAALRTMSLDALLDAGRQKALAAEAHAHLAARRAARLRAVAPVDTLGALAAQLAPADRPRLDALRAELGDLLGRAADQNRWNHTFAETGRALIDGTLRVMQGRVAGPSATYGQRGRIRAGERRPLLDRRA